MAKLVLGGDNRSVTPAFFTIQEKEIEVIKETVIQFGLSLPSLLGTVDENGVYHAPSISSVLDCSGVSIIDGEFTKIFYSSSFLTGVLFPDLVKVTGGNTFSVAFSYCTDLTTVDLSALEEADGDMALNEMFYTTGIETFNADNLRLIQGVYAATRMIANCGNLVSASFANLESIEGEYSGNSIFAYNTNLTSINMPKLKTIRGDRAGFYMMEQTGLTTYTFESLEEATGHACLAGLFDNCSELESVYFPKLKIVGETTFSERYDWDPTYPHQLAFGNCPKLMEIHFRADMQTTIESLFGYSSKFGAEQANIYFDL